jgi:tripartite-type tricarboxylate transporter receptor subunit TctC
MELLKQETGVKLVHVPYKGMGGALNDLVGGHVQAAIVALQTAAPHVQSGKLRMLAVMGAERSPAFPDVPTLRSACARSATPGATSSPGRSPPSS